MKILFDINHPSHVHAFKNIIRILNQNGHTCFVTARRKELTHTLLTAFSIPFTSSGSSCKSIFCKAFQLFRSVILLFGFIFKCKPHIIISFESPYAALAGRLCFRKVITLADTETANLIHQVISRLSNTILTPSCFSKNLSENQLNFAGYKELLYLHPAVFIPDSSIIKRLGIEPGRKYVIIRFVAFNALHDISKAGFTDTNKLKLVLSLSEKVRVFVTSELPLSKELKPFQINIGSEYMHHAMAFSTLFIGESTTMAAEAAILGVPSICLNDADLGYIRELSDLYGLIYTFCSAESDQQSAISKAHELLTSKTVSNEYLLKRDKMLSDKIDLTAFMVWFIENYPKSEGILKENPDYQYNFR